MKPKNASTIGLDIGNYSVKLVELVRTKDKVTVKNASIIPVGDQPPDNIVPLVKPLVPALQRSPRLRVVLSGSALLVRCVPMPVMTHAELKSAIRFEAENHIAFPIDDCILDFQIVSTDEAKKQMNVLLVAAKRDFIQERVRTLMDMEVRPQIIDVDTFCLVNAFDALSSEPEEKAYALLNIGHRVTSFAIIKDKQPLFVRDLPMGGQSVSKALADEKGISEEEADKIKLEPGEEAAALKTAVEHGYETLIEELKRSIDYFESESGEPFKNVWLSGGGALVAGATAALAAGLGKEVTLWDAMKKLDFPEAAHEKTIAEHGAEFSVALGLALRK